MGNMASTCSLPKRKLFDWDLALQAWISSPPRQLSGLSPREAAELLVNKARQRAQGGGDNLSLAIVRLVEGD